MLPYFQLPSIPIFGQRIEPFVYLILSGMLLCYFLAQRRVRQVGLYSPIAAVALFWITIGGFIGAHMFEMLAYHPHLVAKNPFILFEIWSGLSSFGGFIGGFIAFIIYTRRQGVWMLAYLDALFFGFVPGWILARSACAVSHDHPGRLTTFFLGIQFPDGIRHDLGFYEMLWAIVMTLALYLLPQKERFVGFYTAYVLFLYAPMRFLLETLRIADKRYFGFTPAQYLSIVLIVIATTLIIKGKKNNKIETDVAESTQNDS